MYLYLIMCLICRFIVSTNKAMKYNSKMGQKTGMLNTCHTGDPPTRYHCRSLPCDCRIVPAKGDSQIQGKGEAEGKGRKRRATAKARVKSERRKGEGRGRRRNG